MASPSEVDELTRRLWEEFAGAEITLDRRGRPNRFVVRSLAKRLLDAAYEAGIRDPLHEIDWIDVLDPRMSATENMHLFTEWLQQHVGRKVEVSEEADRYVAEMERYLANLRSELEKAPPEAKPSILEEIARIEGELEKVRGKLPPKPPTPIIKAREVPLEEARARLERYIKDRVPRVYRLDWTDLKARISHHRDSTEALTRIVGELGGRIVEVKPARPPLMIITVDMGEATLPPMILPPDVEKYLLWSKFSAILSAAGVRPEEYRRDFEEALKATEGRPLEERQSRVERIARALIPPPPTAPTVPTIIPREVLDRLERLEKAVREVRESVAWRPRSAEDVRAIAEATLLAAPPRVVVRVDENGHAYYGPSDECMQILMGFMDKWALHYFTSCPACRYGLPGGALSPIDFVEHLIGKEGAVPPLYVNWLRSLARTIEEAERGGVAPP
jgi:hypothetical protein